MSILNLTVRLENAMVDPFAKNPEPTTGPGAERARADLDAQFQHLRHDAAGVAAGAADAVRKHASEAADAASNKASATRASFSSDAGESFKDQASQAASDAKGAAASIAEQVRGRLAEMVDQQKAAGASRIAGVAQAAQKAANDLDPSNPELARLVRSAANSIDRVAADVGGRDIGDVVDTIASFGRRQPVAFFGGAVLTGFLLARFFKSEAPVMSGNPAGPV